MTGGDPKMAIHAAVPSITDEQIDSVLTVISHQPAHEQGTFTAMLGLDGAPVTVHTKGITP